MRVIKCCFLLFAMLIVQSVSSSAFAGQVLEGWVGDVFLGYNKTSGNTDKSSGSASGRVVKKFEHSQYSIKGDVLYSESNSKMDGQSWNVLNKYSLDFGKGYRWYNFYQVLTDHDYFSDIDYRVTPSAGLGYHIATGEFWIWDADAGAGYRITRHRVNTAEDDEAPSAMAHTFMKKMIFEKASLSEDLTAYPGLRSGDGILVRSESVFTNPLRDNLDFEIRYIVDYNSEPAGKKKMDTQLIAGIKYKF